MFLKIAPKTIITKSNKNYSNCIDILYIYIYITATVSILHEKITVHKHEEELSKTTLAPKE